MNSSKTTKDPALKKTLTEYEARFGSGSTLYYFDPGRRKFYAKDPDAEPYEVKVEDVPEKIRHFQTVN